MTDAIEMLKEEHAEVHELLEELTETTARATKTRPKLLEKIRIQLEAHTTIEEQIFYPAVRNAMKTKEDQALYFEAMEEHKLAKSVMKELAKSDPETPQFSAKAKVLKDLVTHHADEEEKELLPMAEKLLSKEQRQELQQKMMKKRKSLLERATNGQSARA